MEWKWGTVDAGRAGRALAVKVVSLNPEAENPSAVVEGSQGNLYHCTLESCDCRDFQLHASSPTPCKHMVRLAMECGILGKNGLTEKEQHDLDISALESELMKYAWHYHVLNDPLIPDVQYDKLKRQYLDELGITPSGQDDDPLISYFQKKKYAYIDFRKKGGSFYFYAKAAADYLKSEGYNVEYLENGTKATLHRPAYCIRNRDHKE